ncbi:MAG: T9SS type A sorting domain-containing protein [bacterium]|nr:T9SS type A sorting domain-containing protein [bacterium]
MKILTIQFLSILTFLGNLFAQNSWVPDPSFGNNGITRVNFGSGYGDYPNDLLVLPDGKILVAGKSTSSFDYFIAMTQLLPNGQPDISGFGNDGKVSLHFVLRDHANDIELQPDGKILVAGTQAEGNGVSQITPALYRFNSDGSLDTTFADSGKAVHRFNGNRAGEMYGVKVLSDGRIITAGLNSSSSVFGVMRFLPDGERDLSFGDNGEALLPYPLTWVTYHPVGCLFLGDTAVVMATVTDTAGLRQFVLGMIDSSGNPVSSFGNNGIVLTGIEGSNHFSGGESLVLTSDGKILMSGTTPDSGPRKFSVFRFLMNGDIDTTFGNGGRTDIQFSSHDVCYDMKIDSNGKILLVGSSESRVGVARLNSDGTPDTTFAPDGKLILNLNNSGGTHYLTNCIPLDNSDILAAGFDFASNSGDFMITRLTQNPTGINDYNNIQPNNFVLYQNFPNPFNPSTVISYQLPVSSNVTLKVYGILGNEVATLVNDFLPSGSYETEFSGVGLTSGIYFYQVQASNFVETKKMILIK